MGKATAPHVIKNFEAASKGLNKNKFTQVSSDGPNVNLKFYEFLAEEHKDDGLNEFIYIGACSLRFKMQKIQPFGTLKNCYERCIRFLINII